MKKESLAKCPTLLWFHFFAFRNGSGPLCSANKTVAAAKKKGVEYHNWHHHAISFGAIKN